MSNNSRNLNLQCKASGRLHMNIRATVHQSCWYKYNFAYEYAAQQRWLLVHFLVQEHILNSLDFVNYIICPEYGTNKSTLIVFLHSLWTFCHLLVITFFYSICYILAKKWVLRWLLFFIMDPYHIKVQILSNVLIAQFKPHLQVL